jgi:CheY-like chemotaxis protein
MAGDLEEGSPTRRHAEQIRKAALRASSLTSQLLAFSRKQVMQPRVVDVNTILRNLLTMLRRIINEDIELLTDLADVPVCVRADVGQLEQVVLNLAVNARDAMPNGGSLTLRTSRDGEDVRIDVIDTGSGMDEQTSAHLFEPFFTTKPNGRGTGLGLSTVYGIVSQSGGRIDVDTAPNAGTTFRIWLPRVEELPQSDGSPLIKEIPRGSETILLVEDDAQVRTFIRDALETHGYRVLVADDGHAALQLAKVDGAPIHLLVTDVIMPRMNGSELAERIRLLRPAMRTLFITGYAGNALTTKGDLAPHIRVVQKPFTVTQLARQVRDVLDA